MGASKKKEHQGNKYQQVESFLRNFNFTIVNHLIIKPLV